MGAETSCPCHEEAWLIAVREAVGPAGLRHDIRFGVLRIETQANLVYRRLMSDSYRLQKNAFARYATGVTVVSCRPPKAEPLGITVNSFTSVSLEPTLVLWCIDRNTSVFDAFIAADNYAVSVLTAAQQDMSNRFAKPGNHAFDAGEGEVFTTGAPLLADRLAGFDCRVVGQHDAGDHVILLGQVVHFDSRDGEPLIYAGRSYMTGPLISDR